MMPEAEDDFMDIRKIILVGDAGTGKSNIVYCYTKEKAPNNIMPTVAVEFTSKLVKLDNGTTLKAQIWDTAGQQNYRSLTMNYYHKVIGALIVFDVSRRSTYEHIPQWLQSLREKADVRVQIGLVGHKIDIGRREVSKEQAELYAAKERLFYCETTIRDLSTINSSFKRLFTNISNILTNSKGKTSELKLNQINEQTNNSCSC